MADDIVMRLRNRIEMYDPHRAWKMQYEAANEIERLRKIEAAARNVAETLNGGFVACSCGRQESTTDLDFASQLYAALGIEPEHD